MTTEPVEDIAEANEARRGYLQAHGIGVPMDQMYLVSLLEYVIDSEEGSLDAAKAYHERRIAPILDQAIAGVQQAQEHARAQQARNTLLEGIHG